MPTFDLFLHFTSINQIFVLLLFFLHFFWINIVNSLLCVINKACTTTLASLIIVSTSALQMGMGEMQNQEHILGILPYFLPKAYKSTLLHFFSEINKYVIFAYLTSCLIRQKVSVFSAILK